MKSRNLILIVVIGLILLLGGCGCSGYNSMVGLDENVKAKWANVQSDYQRRADLIPNLVSTVKGAANFEQETLTRVIEARAKATQTTISPENLTPENIERFQQAQGEVSSALSRLLVTVERYPELKANQNFLNLQTQLEGTENRIKVSRNDFNASVQEYNQVVRRFPNVIYAGMLGFPTRQPFQADPGAQTAPSVNFNTDSAR
ncbi:MAG: LemA family protein [Chitinophagaceae bacterium]|nr:MAG: LemA family protein [Chitinophagaceae bacterium]